MDPRTKSTEYTNFLEDISQKMFGRSRTESLNQGICVDCGKPAKEFREPKFQKEYNLSALCQVCQDSIS